MLISHNLPPSVSFVAPAPKKISIVKNVRPRESINGRNYYANDFDVFNAEIWAREAMRVYDPAVVLGGLIHRDFSKDVHKFGDIVNAIVPGRFTMSRKGALCEDVVTQDGDASSIQVPLNQYLYVSFQICDGEEDRGLLDLVTTMLTPAVEAIAQGVDQIIANQVYQFLDNPAGHLNTLTDSNVQDYILEASEVMDNNNAPTAGRVMVVSPAFKTKALSLDLFTDVASSGSRDGLIKGVIGEKLGFQFAMSQRAPRITTGQTAITTTITDPTTPGTTVVNVASATGLAAGQWIVIAGDDVPQQIVSIATLAVTITPGTVHDTADNAVATRITGGLVNMTGGMLGTSTSPRRVGYSKVIATDGWTGVGPKVGQMVTFGTNTVKYGIISVTVISGTAYGIMLDKPLESTVADDATVNLGPSGQYNFGLIKNAFAMVNRPLPKPRTGALSSVISRNNLSLRVTITYDGRAQAHLVTVDTLFGIGKLSDELGVALLG